jgi:hypothetical protein
MCDRVLWCLRSRTPQRGYDTVNHTPTTPSAAGSTTRRRSPWRIHLAVLLAYLVLAVVLTWPTVTHLATHLPGDGGDDPAIAWNLWWVKHALLTLHTSPLVTDYMFYPIGINLAFYTLTVLNALTAMPLTLTLGVVTASNLHTWFTMAAGGYGVFLLARQLGNRFGPAAFAGICYAFASSQLFYVSLGQFNIASSHWLPYVLLFIVKARREPRVMRWPLLAALFLVMQAWAEMTYASFVAVFVALYVVYEAVASWARAAKSQIPSAKWQIPGGGRGGALLCVRNVALAAILFVVGISPLLAAMLPDMQAEGDFWVQGSGFAEAFSADLLGFLVPTMHHPLLGGLVHSTGITAFDKGQHIFLGATLLVLALVGAVWGRRQRGRLFWVLAALFFGWLSLGPTAHVNGADTGIPGPFVLLQSLPFFKGNRYPSRYSVLLVLSLAMLAAPGIEVAALRLARRLRRPANGLAACLSLALAALFVAEHLSVPLPQSDMRVPAPYETLAGSPGTLLDIPFAWRNGFRITGPIDPGFMFGQFYQTVHGQRLVQGNTSRNPEFKFQYFTEAPVLNSLLALETGHTLPPGRLEADRALAADVLRFFDIRHIVVRRGPGAEVNSSVVPEATIYYIEAALPVERIQDTEALTMYRVQLPPLPRAVQVSPEDPLIRLYLGEGWGPLPDRQARAEDLLWAQRTSVRVLLPLAAGPARLTMRLYAPGDGQWVSAQLNGWRSAPASLSPGWGEVAFDLPAGTVREGMNDLWLEFDRLYPILDLLGLPADLRSSGQAADYKSAASNASSDSSPTNAGSNISLVVQSAGEEVGDFAHIYVNGVDVSPNERGYNVVVVAPDGSVRSAAFDTHLDPAASQRMAEFVAGAAQGALVAAAVADEGSMRLGEEGVAALRSLGAEGDLRGKFRWSHAVLGVKGGAPGTAIEAMDGLRPVTLALGPPVSAPSVAAGMAWLRLEVAE